MADPVAARGADLPDEALRQLLDNAAVPIHQVGRDGRILWANRAELEMLDCKPEEYVGQPVAAFHADPATIQDILGRLSRGETLREVPARLLRRDGSIRHVLISSNARFEGGEVRHTLCFTRDVTDRHLIEEARSASGKLLESTHDGFMRVDAQWRILYANPAARQGRRREEFEGRVLWDLFPEAVGTEFEARYRKAMESRERVTFESFYAAMDAWMENTVLPVEEGLWIYYRDVSARRGVEAQLQARNRQQAAVARIGQAALSGVGVASLLEMAATEVCDTLEVGFCKVLELLPDGQSLLLRAGKGWRPGNVGITRVPADSASQAGYTLAAQHPVIVSDLARENRFFPPAILREHGVASGMSVIIHGQDRPWGVLGAHSAQRRMFTEDDVNFLQGVANLLATVIERRRVEQELRRHRDHLEDLVAERTRRLAASNQELEAFNYSVSHDLRTPLRAISGLSGLLAHRHGPDLPASAQQIIAQIQGAAIRMGTLLEELLNLSRYHQIELSREPVDLSDMAQEVMQAQQAAGGPMVTWSVQPGIQVEADPHLMRVVIENLIGNAWKFTGRVQSPHVHVTAMATLVDVTVCVRDNGAGFDMAYAQKLFQPFQRLHSPTEFEGTGIGLATVARIVQRHGGKVWAEGRVDGGASFYFSLPR